jgi:hypothetical protein
MAPVTTLRLSPYGKAWFDTSIKDAAQDPTRPAATIARAALDDSLDVDDLAGVMEKPQIRLAIRYRVGATMPPNAAGFLWPDGGNAMKNRLYCFALGGLSFWLPAIVVAAALHQNLNLWVLNGIPLAGVTLLGAVSWIATKHPPKWGWVLAGIYILGPVSMLAASALLHVASSPNVPGEKAWMFMDRSAERDDFFRANRDGDAAISRGIPERSGTTAWLLTLAMKP